MRSARAWCRVYANPIDQWTPETRLQFALAYQTAGMITRLYLEAGFAVMIDGVTSEPDMPMGSHFRAAEGAPPTIARR